MIEPKYSTLDRLFRDRVFRIPRYQRFYSWQDKQVEDLLEDIFNLSKKRNTTHHFMATIVCFSTGQTESVKTEEYNVFEVVDGQQRITTLAILLKAIELRIDDADTKKYISKLLVKDDSNLLLLQANNVNERLFNTYLRQGVPPTAEDIRMPSDECFERAIRNVDKFLDKWVTMDDLISLTGILRNRIGFVVYDTADTWAVHSIFESLNSRGLPVDWLDKAKSVLMGIAFEKAQSAERADAVINELHNLWAQIYSRIAEIPKYADDVLRIAVTYNTPQTAKKPLDVDEAVERLRLCCDSTDMTVSASVWILRAAEKMIELKNRIVMPTIAKFFHARALSLALMLADWLTVEEQALAIEQLERVTFRIYVLFGSDSKTKVPDYFRLAFAIHQRAPECDSAQKVMEQLIKLGGKYPIGEATKLYFREPDNYTNQEENCRYLLWRYEEFLARKNRLMISPELKARIWNAKTAAQTIEHILPHAHEKTIGWRGMFESSKARNCVNRLANLLLLPPGLNSEASRKMFSDKVSIYKRAEGLRMVKEVVCLSSWDASSFDKRQKKLKEFVEETFCDLPV